MPRGRVLVVEDDAAIRRGLCDALTASGFVALEAADGQAGLELALSAEIDAVLLDVLMPRLTGLDVLSAVRRTKPQLPVIMLTARGEEEDRVRGLRLGADDYVVKPFSIAELIARIEAVLRRSAERPREVRHARIAGRHIDFERREIIHADGQRIALPDRELEVLAYLVSNSGRAVSRDELLRHVWGVDPRGVQTRTIDMAIARLREHLRDDPAQPSVIATVRGKGYMLAIEAGTDGRDVPRDTRSPAGDKGLGP